MNLTLKHAAATIILMLSLAAPLVAGPLEDGYSAYTRGDFATAMRIMRPLAEQDHATAQTVVGLIHYFNYGDYVSAHMWVSLAAAQGHAFAEMFLRDAADKMTSDQIAERRNSHESGNQIRSRLLVRGTAARDAGAMSALPPIADMCGATRHVRFVPIADSCATEKRGRLMPPPTDS